MMRTALSRCKLLAAIALLTLALGSSSPGATYAATASITPPQPLTYIVEGTYHDSGVTLTQDVPWTPSYVNIQISDQSLLRTGWKVKIDNEVMLIDDLIDGGPGYPLPPDTMVVERGWSGTYSAAHGQGAKITGPSVIVDIWAKGITDATGLGAFAVYLTPLTLPPGAELLGFMYQDAWLSSTDREPWCDGPVQQDGTWKVMCWTTYDPSPGPAGPTGDGVIARAIVLPPPSGVATFSLDGSVLSNRNAETIPSNVQNMSFRIISCPDANLDRFITIADVVEIARNSGDQGKNCGVTLSSNASNSQTTLDINDQSLAWWGPPPSRKCAGVDTNRPDTITIDDEIMTVGQFNDGSPDTVTVTRSVNGTRAKSHLAGSPVYLTPSQWDGNFDGKNGFTASRDVNHDSVVNIADTAIAASVLGMQCPSGG